MTLKGLIRLIILIVVIFFLGYLWYTAISGSSNLNLNSNLPQYKMIHLSYPNIEPEELFLMGSTYSNLSTEKLAINVTLQYQGTLAEGTPINVSAGGNLYDISLPIKILAVGFESANSNIGDNGEIIMRNPLTSPIIGYPAQTDLNLEEHGFLFRPVATKNFETISWDAPGDYTPYITIWDLNNTPVTYEYPTKKIHVSASDVTIQEKFSFVNLWLTYAILFATSVMLILAIIPKKYLDLLVAEDK